jgi:ABC-type multidrug transport system ATPase subunit
LIDKYFDANDPILIENLSKEFGKVRAVDSLLMSIRKDEVVSILGHNGAGKTTFISMLTGFLQPTSGDASIYG